MEINYPQLLIPIREALLKGGLSDVVSSVEKASDLSKRRNLILLNVDTNHLPAFQSWISESLHLPETLVMPCAKASPEDEEVPVLANKVIAILPCNDLLGFETLEAIERLLLTRPANSYAIVLAGAVAAIRDSEELDFVERSAWRLFVPEAKAPWAGQCLADSAIFLWDNADTDGLLGQRLQKDAEALRAVLLSTANTEALDRWRFGRLLDRIEATVEERLEKPQSSPDGARLRLENVLEQIDTLEKSLKKRVIVDRDHTKRRLTASLQALEQRLRDGWRREAESLSGTRDVSELTKRLVDYNATQTEGWLVRLRTELEAEQKDSMEEMTFLYSGLDWEIVNRGVLGSAGLAKYPDRIVAAMRERLNLERGSVFGEAEAPIPLADGVSFRTRFATACIGAVAGCLIGGPLGGAVFGGLSIIFASHSSRSAITEAMRAAGTQWLHQNIEQAHREAEQWTVRFARSIEGTLDSEFRILRERIADILEGMYSPEADRHLRDVLTEISKIRGIVSSP
jgi:hypothetical protein